MEKAARRMALFGGTFDPIHNGHVQMALEFARRLRLDRVLLMPTFVPPHKMKQQMASVEDRLAMCRLAAQEHPVLEVSDLEARRGGASFTADTLEALHAQYPDAQWYLITGADMFCTLSTWWRFDAIAERAVLCAAPRDDIGYAQLCTYAEKLGALGARCAVEDIPLVRVSSTEIREAAARGEDLTRWLPPAVADYVRRHQLYQQGGHPVLVSQEEQFVDILKKRLTPERFAHSLAVADEAERLAGRYGADAVRARTAGLLHDVMKDTPPDVQLQMLQEFGILLDSVEQHAPKLWHAVLGAAFLEHILGIRDPEILQAVRYHTTGRAGMSPLEKIVYLADLTAAGRSYADIAQMRRLADSDLDDAVLYALVYTIRSLSEKRQAIHPDTFAAYNDLVLSKR